MTEVKIAEIEDGRRFQGRLMLDKNFLLLDPEIPFSKALQHALMEWEFKTAYIEEVQTPAAAVLPKPVKKPNPIGAFEQVDFDPATGEIITKKKTGLNADAIEAINNANSQLASADENAKIEIVRYVYDEYLRYIEKLFTRYITHRELNQAGLYDASRKLCDFVNQNKKYILRILANPEGKVTKNFLISHCLRSTIFAIVIGAQMGLTGQKLYDLAVAASVHEIGQIKLPPQLYITNKPLSPQARTLLTTHVVLGFNILKENNFDPIIQLAVLEHHERENGTGYPRRLEAKKISTYGKILSVACVYEAISAPRQYKDAKSTYEATIEMLQNSQKIYNETVVKALVQAISLFPIGTYVYLSNGRIAQVTDTNPNDPRTPLVQLLGEKNEAGNPKVVLTDNSKLRIARVLTPAELKDIQNYLNRQ